MGVTATAPLLLLLIPLVVGLVVGLQLLAKRGLGRHACAARPAGARPPRVGAGHGPRGRGGRPAGRPARHRLRGGPLRLGRQRGSSRGPGLRPGGPARNGPTTTSPAWSRSARTPSWSGSRTSWPTSTGSPPRPCRGATDIGAALRLAAALFPDATQQRIVLLSDGNDTTGTGQVEAARAGARGNPGHDPDDRPRRVRRGPRGPHQRAHDVAPRRGAGGRGRGPLDGRPAGRGAPVRRRRPRRDGADDPRGGHHARRLPGDAEGGRLPRLPGGRRGGPGHLPPERPGRRLDARLGPAARPRGARRRGGGGGPGEGAQDARGRRRDDAPRARPRRPGHAVRLRQHRPRRRARGSASRRSRWRRCARSRATSGRAS